jgi:dihydrofolate synthase/folylpolyglutamate synthase
MDTVILQKKAAENGLEGSVYASVSIALETAKKEAKKNDLIFVGGSNFTVAEVV